MNFRSGLRIVSNIPLIWTHGEVNKDAVPAIQKRVDELLKSGWNTIIIDLSKAKYVDTDGLVLLGNIHRECIENEGKMAVVCAKNSRVCRVLNLVRLNEVFGIHYSAENAVSAITSG